MLLVLALWLAPAAAATTTILSVERLTITLANAASSQSATPTLGQDLANTVPFATFRIGTTNTNAAGDFEDFHAHITFSGGNVVLTRSGGGGNHGSIVAEVNLVEFDPDHWTVQRGTATMTVTTSVDASITAVSDTARTFIVHYGRLTSAGSSDGYGVHASQSTGFVDNSTIRFTRGQAVLSLEIPWWVVEDVSTEEQQIKVQRVTGTLFEIASGQSESSGTLETITIPQRVSTSRTFLLAGWTTPAVADSYIPDESVARAVLLNSNTMQYWRGFDGSNQSLAAQVVEFVGSLGRVRRGFLQMTGTVPDVSVTGVLSPPITSGLAIPWLPSSVGSVASAAVNSAATTSQTLSLVTAELATVTTAFDRITMQRSMNGMSAGNRTSHISYEIIDWTDITARPPRRPPWFGKFL